MSAPNEVDFDVQHHVSIALLRPDTIRAHAWCSENLPAEDSLMWGTAYVVDPRYLEEILRAIVQGGLTVRL